MTISIRDYYCYKFQVRDNPVFNPLLYGKRLFQQFVIDTYIKLESTRLDFMRNHQDQLRADEYQGLMDVCRLGDLRVDQVGKRMILAMSFVGGPRDCRRHFMDAGALVHRYDKLDVFLTLTCNPNGDEIT